jgi:hypothetical protein
VLFLPSQYSVSHFFHDFSLSPTLLLSFLHLSTHSHTERVSIMVMLLICIWRIMGSNVDRNTGYPDRGLSWFFSVFPAKVLHGTFTRSWPFRYKFVHFVICLFLTFDAVRGRYCNAFAQSVLDNSGQTRSNMQQWKMCLSGRML